MPNTLVFEHILISEMNLRMQIYIGLCMQIYAHQLASTDNVLHLVHSADYPSITDEICKFDRC